jgi:ferrous iron transport protein B
LSVVAGAAPRVALVGNPNCGKTALFNALTGARQKVANYAGVTVERKEGRVVTPAGREAMILDLPGTYSLRARSPDEAITRDVVLGRLAGEQAPDVLVCVADATNLRLVLRLALELKATGTPMVLALNMFDIATRQGLRIDVERLSAELGLPIVATVATRKRGLEDLLALVDDLALAPRARDVWHEPSATEIREAHRQAERIMKATVRPPERPDTFTGKLDGVLLHPVAGLLVLLTLLFLMFQAVFSWATPAMDGIEAAFTALGAWVGTRAARRGRGRPAAQLHRRRPDRRGGGRDRLPAADLVLFFFIILLEDLGYMARAAFLMDKIMGGAGLHGRAFIPLLSSFACAIPGIMATRVIDAKRDRLATIMVAPLMTCSARIPVYTLIIAAFIPHRQVWGGLVNLQGLVMFGLYAAGIASALAVSFVMRKVFWRGAVEPFIMELPTFKTPDALNVARNVYQRGEIFMKRAGGIILTLSVIVWLLSTFPGAPPGATGPAIDYSFAGIIGHAIEPIFRPIGFNWQMVVALIPGMAAREVAVAALGTVYSVSAEGEAVQLGVALAHQWSLATALSFLAWYIFAPQCTATLAVVKRETNSWRWPVIMFVYMVSLAYLASFCR